MQRIALYIRVSTREQKLHGFSIATQRDILTKYAADHPEYHVVDEYIDDGYTASNTRRPALQRLLNDVRAGKIDLIVFTKLDRWFRSVQKYYFIQSVLDEHNVYWKAVQEDYETITSSGRFKVNIMLSVAQNEIDRTSERIRDVFKYKLEQGHIINGQQPYGYGVENGKPILNPNAAHIVQEIYNTFELEQSLRKTMIIINARHNLNIGFNSIRNV